jgi:hypothetical protein
MVRKSKSKKFAANEGNWNRETVTEVSIPDEAISSIVSNHLTSRATVGVPTVIGVSPHTVEDVLQLLVDWSAKNGYIKDNVIHIGVDQNK